MTKFNTKRIIILVTLSVFTISAILIGVNRLRAKSQYNLILISVDTLRADHMGVYGYPKNTTPNIDKWAKDAFVFTNMRTIIPSTYPSFATFMTGESPSFSRIFTNSISYEGVSTGMPPINDKITTLAEILKKNNFSSSAFINTASLNADLTHLNRGFDTYENYEEGRLDGPNSKEQYKSYSNSIEAIKWLEENKDERFFLWVHFMEPHGPYLPTDEFKCKFNPEFCDEISRRGLEDLEKERFDLKECQSNGLPDDKVELYKTLYDGGIASADKLIGGIFDKLKQSGLDKNTVVVFYGDHGEGFDHNYYFFHNHMLYDSFIKIPFIVKHPNLSGEKIDIYLQNTNIMSTLLDLLNIPLDKNEMDGGSFKPLFNKNLATEGHKPSRYLYFINTKLTKYAVQDGQFKYIYSLPGPRTCLYNKQTEELYDLKNDQEERNNLVEEKPEIASRLKKALLDYLAQYNLPKPVGVEKSREIPEEQRDVIEKLKSLGY